MGTWGEREGGVELQAHMHTYIQTCTNEVFSQAAESSNEAWEEGLAGWRGGGRIEFGEGTSQGRAGMS